MSHDDDGGDGNGGDGSDDQADERHAPDVSAGTGPLATLTLAEIDRRLGVLTPQVGLEELVTWLDLTAVMLSRAKAMRHALEQVAVEWIGANGPIDVGDIRYTAGTTATTRCLDSQRCAELVLAACGGDLNALVAYLRSDPWKYGSVRQLLADDAFRQVFRTEHRAKLLEGRRQTQLLRTDRRFSGGKESQP